MLKAVGSDYDDRKNLRKSCVIWIGRTSCLLLQANYILRSCRPMDFLGFPLVLCPSNDALLSGLYSTRWLLWDHILYNLSQTSQFLNRKSDSAMLALFSIIISMSWKECFEVKEFSTILLTFLSFNSLFLVLCFPKRTEM